MKSSMVRGQYEWKGVSKVVNEGWGEVEVGCEPKVNTEARSVYHMG